jgi:hypothetical protein
VFRKEKLSNQMEPRAQAFSGLKIELDLEQIRRFYLNENNVIQNSLICALRGVEGGKVEFKAEYGSILGKLKISFPDLYTADYLFLFTLLP